MVDRTLKSHACRSVPASVLVAAVCAVVLSDIPCHALTDRGLTELEFILQHNPIRDSVERGRAPIQPPEGVGMFLVTAIRFYQSFISTQDMPSCNFSPSCSQFGVESIRRLGVIRGVLLTADRLQRCNSMSTSRYEIDRESGKLADPVQIYCELFK